MVFDSQCYSLNIYNENALKDGLFSNQSEKQSVFDRTDNINDRELEYVRQLYSDKSINKHDILIIFIVFFTQKNL